MNNEPLYISFYSVVVKRSAVEWSYAGGLAEFDRVLQPARSSGELSVLVSMSMEDANRIFIRLHKAGLTPGEHFGFVGMQDGALVPCHGIRVNEHMNEDRLFPSHTVVADPSYRYQPQDVRLVWQPPELPVVDRRGKRTPLAG